MPAAALQTPVDLSNYSEHFVRAAEPGPDSRPVVDHQPQAAVSYAPPPLMVSRRPALELSLPIVARGGNGVPPSTEGGMELASPLDVPAFLRRQN
jgi:hypothetical protein